MPSAGKACSITWLGWTALTTDKGHLILHIKHK
jgi:hypothetical protein